ncbi:MAG: nucleoside triphosphate pyrophosphohydrolase, partial [Polyangia bacterium]|nr:nucleoside triphosphate pyrophosphohydrolase [Polyangia bacterium]
MEEKETYTFEELLGIMDRLLGEGGCPWDRQQSLEGLRSYLLEETYEVLEALEEGDPVHHQEELGDLLFQVVFQAALRKREGRFGMEEVVSGIARKLVRRHPHVFSGPGAASAAEARGSWARLKEEEARARGQRRRTLEGVPRALPALLRAQRLQQKASEVGFDWAEPQGALDKIHEELGELRQAVELGDGGSIRGEAGDLLGAVVNYVRLLGVDAEDALSGASRRFEARFGFIEERLWELGREPRDASL